MTNLDMQVLNPCTPNVYLQLSVTGLELDMDIPAVPGLSVTLGPKTFGYR
jgi:hypothetical protein